VNNTGLVEIPLGITLREMIYEIGGGIAGGRKFKAVQTGGPSGGCIPESHLDTPVDYDSLGALGSIMGSGGMIVMDDRDCMVNVAKYFIAFTQEESCGKCTPCREGTLRMMEMLEAITEGKGGKEDLEKLSSLAQIIKKTSLCGLGQTAPNPVLSTLRYFQEEYRAHLEEHKCPAKACKPLINFRVDEDKCNGCHACYLKCPAEAVEGEKKAAHRVIQEKCIKCGTCLEACKFDAVLVE